MGARTEVLIVGGPKRAVLVRPDGFIAWRSRDAAADAAAVLRHVLTEIFLDLVATDASGNVLRRNNGR